MPKSKTSFAMEPRPTRRNRAKRLHLVWRALPRTKSPNGFLYVPVPQ